MILSNKIVLIGAGNVATHLGIRLREKGFSILQVYSHTIRSAQELGEKLNSPYISDIQCVNPNADIYIFSITDSALPGLLKNFPKTNGMLIHTSGSLPIGIFDGYDRYGVLYPLQTFSKSRPVDFGSIPLFIESDSKESMVLLRELAFALSTQVYPLPSHKRKALHLAAVFACNFTNRMYAIASELLEEENIPCKTLLPLIEETARKIESLHPIDAQTGPAIRHNENILDMHRELLKDKPELLEIYNLITKSIQGL